MAIPIIATDNNSFPLRPKNDLDPKYKQNNPQYSLDYAKFIYYSYRMGRTGIKPDDINLIEECRKYATGRQDPNKYKKIFLGEQAQVIPTDSINNPTASVANQREGWVDMNFEQIFSPLPKYMMNIVGMMETQEHDIFCEAQDERSLNTKEDTKYLSLINARHKDFADFVKEKLGLPQTEQPLLPKNVQELSMFESMGAFKLPYEIAMEHLLNHTQHISDYKKLKRRIIWDLVCCGKSGTVSYKDPVTGVVKDKWIDVQDLIIEDSLHEDFKDATYGAIPENISIVDLRAQNPTIPEPELESLAQRYLGVMGNPNVLGSVQPSAKTNIYTSGYANYAYNDIRVPVLYCVWKTTDSEYYTTRKNGNGKNIEVYEPYRSTETGMLPPKTYDTEKRKTVRTDIRTLYQCRWVIGTDFVYDYGKFHDIPFDFKCREVQLPFHVFRLPGRSIIDNSMLLEDQLHMAFLRLQNAIAKAPPPGIAIEFGSLENMEFAGKKWSPLDVIKLRAQSGNYIYRQVSPIPGQPITQNKPFEELRGGLGTAVTDALQTFELIYTQLAEVTGVDRLSAVSKSPTSDQAVGVSELAVSATSNTLRPIYTGYLTIKENQSRCDALMLQSVIQTPEGEEVYKKIVGGAMVDAIKVAGNYPPVEWGFKIIAQPDDMMKNEVRQAAMGAMAGGKNGIPALTYSDYLFIVEHLNTGAGIKYARAYIAYKEGERDKQAAQIAQANVQNQTQSQMQLADFQMKSELTKIQAQLEADKEKLVLEASLKTATEQSSMAMQMELAKFNASMGQPQGQSAPTGQIQPDLAQNMGGVPAGMPQTM